MGREECQARGGGGGIVPGKDEGMGRRKSQARMRGMEREEGNDGRMEQRGVCGGEGEETELGGGWG